MRKYYLKSLAVILGMVILLSTLSVSVSAEDLSGTLGDNLEWTLEEGCLKISGKGKIPDGINWSNSSDIKKIEIGSGVTSIGKSVFKELKNLKEVTIPETVTSISDNAFEKCIRLEKVNFQELDADGVLTLGSYIFFDCFSLVSVNLPSGIESIPVGAFAECVSLKTITIPNTVVALYQNSFYGCTALETVNFGENSCLRGIDRFVFQNCCSLKNIAIPESVEIIANTAFDGCLSLESLNIPQNATVAYDDTCTCLSLKEIDLDENNKNLYCDENGSLYLKTDNQPQPLMTAVNSGLTKLKIGTAITEFYFYMLQYRYLKDLEEITVEKGNTNFAVDENGVLYNAAKTKLYKYPSARTDEEFTIPATVKEIDVFAFWGAKNLKSVSVDTGNEYFSSVDGVVYNKNMTEIIWYPAGKTDTVYTVPATVETLRGTSFADAENLQEFSVSSDNKFFVSIDGVLYKVSSRYNTIWAVAFPCGKNLNEYTLCDADYYKEFFDSNIDCNDFKVCIYLNAFWGTNIKTLNIPKEFGGVIYWDSGNQTIRTLPLKVDTINYEGEFFFDCFIENLDLPELIAATNINSSVKLPEFSGGGSVTPDEPINPDTNVVIEKDSENGNGIKVKYDASYFDNNDEVFLMAEEKDRFSSNIASYDKDGVIIKRYDIRLVDKDNVNVKSTNDSTEYTVKIPVPTGYEDYTQFMIRHWITLDNGNKESEIINAKVADGYIVFTTKSFSCFEVLMNFGFETDFVELVYLTSAHLPATTCDGLSVTYISSNTDIVAVDANGNITTNGRGTATVTATFENEYGETFTDICEVKVKFTFWQWLIYILIFGFIWY